MAFIKYFCSMSTEICLLCSLTVNSVFPSLWPITIPIFYTFGPWLNVIEDMMSNAIKGWSFTNKQCIENQIIMLGGKPTADVDRQTVSRLLKVPVLLA